MDQYQRSGPLGELLDDAGDTAYRIDGVDRMGPFLMTVVSATDLWMFVSSTGALTAGRVDADRALFPYLTDDRIHRSAGIAGPVTVVARTMGGVREIWRPFGPTPTPGAHRSIVKRTLGDRLVFEERHDQWGLAFRAEWAPSDRFGWVRSVSLALHADAPAAVEFEVLDGLVDVMPAGVDALTEQIRSNLVDAYKRTETGPWGTLAVYSLESPISDRAEPLEALTATTVWSSGFEDAALLLDGRDVDAMLAGLPTAPGQLRTGIAGAYLLRGPLTLQPGEETSWIMAADTGLDHVDLSSLAETVGSGIALDEVRTDIEAGSERLAALLGDADGVQHTADRIADAHHLSNVLFNCMRGGVFANGTEIGVGDLVSFVEDRNAEVAARHRTWFETLGHTMVASDLREQADDTDDPDLVRLVLEYLPLTFSRRHGDPSRPWNRFSINVHDDAGEPVLSYEGNWRDIFQNWEALLQSFPTFFPNVVAKFVNATSIEGYNPYRISRDGIDWEIPDPDDPWSHIGYWGDHQIVYLLRLLEMWERYEPGALAAWSTQEVFVHADVPYRLADHDDIVADPRDTITYDLDRAAAIARREEQLGADGRLLADDDGAIVHVGFVEKLLVPALAKISNLVPGGGIWLNTQRPEWNDANNALAGPGLSMVTLYQLRRYLAVVPSIIAAAPVSGVTVTGSVAAWIEDLRSVLGSHAPGAVDDVERRTIVDALGRSAQAHRDRVWSGRLGGTAEVDIADLVELCDVARAHLDATIDLARRPDGLYHSYNRVSFPSSTAARVDHLGPMLEGQVAIVSSGALDVDEALDVVDALYASGMYRADQDTFLLYPPAELLPFADRNIVGEEFVTRIGELPAVVSDAVVVSDAAGRLRFRPGLVNAKALTAVLDGLDASDADRAMLHAAYEAAFDHDSFTGRSGRMHGYEGIGSVYWHMVAKLLVAVQELYWAALDDGASMDASGRPRPSDTVRRAAATYRRVRRGLGYHKSPAEFGAVPIDCYSHTPAHAGAQQPGMTGQVKEEIITRLGELGLRVDAGRLRLAPGLIPPEEVVGELTVCGVPVRIEPGPSDSVTTETSAGSSTIDGTTVPVDQSARIFGRRGDVTALRFAIGPDTEAIWRSTGGG